MFPCSFLGATFAKEHIFWGTCSWKMDMGILALSSNQAIFSKWLRRPNHYAHETRIEILRKTPVSILQDLSPLPQNHWETSVYSFLAWMSIFVEVIGVISWWYGIYRIIFIVIFYYSSSVVIFFDVIFFNLVHPVNDLLCTIARITGHRHDLLSRITSRIPGHYPLNPWAKRQCRTQISETY